MPVVPGPSLADKDLFILTSHDTFSAPEAFAYDMQALGRAKIVGEVTGGGAHGTNPYRLSAHFTASIPFNRGVNPVTHTDYEGVGVKPDVQVPAKEALLTAHMLALRGVLARTGLLQPGLLPVFADGYGAVAAKVSARHFSAPPWAPKCTPFRLKK